ncbi:MAG: AAA family ATPase, partial [Anaerolineales bacterium]|nr:AAA family ATPase [Anaerolineales bacterium]
SNLGSDIIQRRLKARGAAGEEYEKTKSEVMDVLRGHFRPEFINRIDEIIMFSPLSLEQMEEIVVLQMKEVQDRLNEHNIAVQLTDAARTWLAKEGFDPAFGARPLRRAIQKYVESPLSVELLGGKFKDGAVVVVDVDEKENKIIFHTEASTVKKTKHKVNA